VTATVLALLLAICSDGRQPSVVVDLIELNHHHNEDWTPSFDQVIFWRWDDQYMRYNVIAWHLVDGNDRYPSVTDRKTTVELRRRDGDKVKVYRVESRLFRESWTRGRNDPERINKLVFDEKYREGLRATEEKNLQEGRSGQ
jgi:hypothetical protein